MIWKEAVGSLIEELSWNLCERTELTDEKP
jgi:hypothetical protein